MIKIRNKRIALLLVLAMLATMFVGVGTTSALPGNDYIVVTSDWTPVNADDTSELAGPITVTAGDDWEATGIDTMWAEIKLDNDGEAKFAGTPTFSGNWEVESKTDYTIVIYNDVDTDPALDVSNINLSLSEAATGSINVSVQVWAEDINGAIVNDETDPIVKIAAIDGTDINVTVTSKVKTVTIGDEEVGSKITFKEAGYSSFDPDDVIKVTIKKAGVTWDNSVLDSNEADGTFDQFIDTACAVQYEDDTIHEDGTPWISNSGKVLNFSVEDLNALVKSSVELTPLLVVKPGTTGDITVEVSDSDHNIATETFTIAKVGTDGVAVSVKNDDKDFVYRGQISLFDEVEVKLNPGHALDAEDWFSITLPEGVQFVDDSDYTPFSMEDYYGDPIEDNNGNLQYDGLYDNGRTVWFTVDEDNNDLLMEDIYANIKVTDFAVIADADAVVGDLNVTFGGAVSGTYKIGSVRNAFTIATTPVNSQAGLTSIPAANIVVTETADGALRPTYGEDWWLHGSVDFSDFAGQPANSEMWIEMWDAFFAGSISHTDGDYFDIEMPAGITFDSTPIVKVTNGDLDLGDVSVVDNKTLRIAIDEASTELSTITISNLVYNVFNQPALGDIVDKVGADYNLASDKPLEALTVGAIATNPTSIYVIGAPNFTVNGVVTNVVAPSYVKNDRTYLAIRDITTGLGIDPTNVLWDEANQRVTMIKGNKIVQVTIGSQTMYVNGVAIAMDVAPEMGPTWRTMLPAAFVAQAFGATASWDGLTSTVTIK